MRENDARTALGEALERIESLTRANGLLTAGLAQADVQLDQVIARRDALQAKLAAVRRAWRVMSREVAQILDER